jgi:hypothetical protein
VARGRVCGGEARGGFGLWCSWRAYGQHADAWRAGDPNCRHAARLDVDRWPDDVPVPTFGSRMVCTRCGMIGADARPNWKEQPERSGTLAGEGIDKQRVGPSRRCPAGGEH